MWKLPAKLFNGLLEILNYISVVAIFITAIWIFGDVLGRFIFNQPIPGTTELVKTAILAIVFLGVAYTLKKDGHIRATVLVRYLSPKVRAWFEIFGCLIGILIFILLAVYGWEAAIKAWRVKEFEGVQLRVPTYPSRFIMVLGSVLMSIQYTINLVQNIIQIKSIQKGGV